MNSLRGVLACDQVELAPAVARLDVGQAVVLVRRRAQRLGEHLKAVDAQRQLAAAGAHGGAVDADQVAEVERCQPREGLLAEHVKARVQLDLAGAVDEVEERGLARTAPRGDAPGDAMVLLGLLAGLQMLVGVEDRRDRLDVRERVGERAPGRTRAAARALARRSAISSPGRGGVLVVALSSSVLGSSGRPRDYLRADVDLRDLELARRTAGDLDGDRLAALVPEQRAPDGRLVGELVLLRLGLG